MRTKKFPGLDAEELEFEDLFGPSDSDTVGVYNVRGLDRLQAEGVVDLEGSRYEDTRDPLDRLLEQEATTVFDGRVRYRRSRGRGRRVLTSFSTGYGPGSDPADRTVAPTQISPFLQEVEKLRQMYAR